MAKRKRNRQQPVAGAVPIDLEQLIQIAARAAAKPAPQIELKTRDGDWKRFLERAHPTNVHNLALAHAVTLQNVAEFARDLEQLGCRCGSSRMVGQLVRPADHVDICPVRLRAHRFFASFDATATATAPAERAISPSDP